MYKTKRDRIRATTSELKLLRQSFEPQWREVADFATPYRIRLQLSDYNRGDRRNQRIYDSTATMALRTGESGMMSGITSPAKRWMRLVPKDPYLRELPRAMSWCDFVTNGILSCFEGANTYVTLPTMYGNMMSFATGAMSIEEDPETVIHTRTFPTGSFWIGQDYRGKVNKFYREFRWTVSQLYERLGKSAEFSSHVQDLIDHSKWDEWIDVGHLITPNHEYHEDRPSLRKKPFYSCWFELGTSSTTKGGYQHDDELFLHESGFDSCPVVVGRWNVTEGDVWGIDCPAMTAIGDIKSLQLGEKRAWQGVEKVVNPHWVVPTALQGQDLNFLPGEHTSVTETADARIRPAYEMPPAFLQPLEAKMAQVRERINQAYYVDLFRMLDQLEDRTRTATEIAERKEEKLIQLVPTLGQINRSVLKPMIDRTFEIMVRQNRIPPAPPELRGQALDIEYLGVLAQAQQAIHVGPVERLTAYALQFAQLDQRAVLKLNGAQCIDEIAKGLGVPGGCTRSDEEVEAMMAEQQKAQQMAATLQAMEQGSKAAKNLSDSSLEGDNALARFVGAA